MHFDGGDEELSHPNPSSLIWPLLPSPPLSLLITISTRLTDIPRAILFAPFLSCYQNRGNVRRKQSAVIGSGAVVRGTHDRRTNRAARGDSIDDFSNRSIVTRMVE